MRKNLLFTTIFLSVLLLIFGCAHNRIELADYQPNSAEEKEVVDFMIECDRAEKDRNLTKSLACFHDNATIRGYLPGAGHSHPIYSKKQYEDRLRDGNWEESTLVNPKINVMGDRATMDFQYRNEGYTINETFDLVKENEKWSIIKYDWTWR